MQNVTDFFHQARGFFCKASLVGLSCHAHYSSPVDWCHASAVKLASKIDHTDPRCCMCKVKTHSFSFRKGKIPVVTVVIMYDLLSGKCSTVKVHMFSMTSTLWPSFFGSYALFSLSPQFPIKKWHKPGLSICYYMRTSAPRSDGYSEMRWIQSPSWKASEKTDRSHEWRWSGEIPQATLLHK